MRKLLLSALAILAWGGAVHGATPDDVKAVFLYQFTQYIDWPPAAFNASSDPFVIGIVGKGAVGGKLEAAFGDKAVKGRPLKFARLDGLGAPQNISGIQVLFLEASAQELGGKARELTKGSALLTVGDWEGFAQEGGMVNFRLAGVRVIVDLNVQKANDAGLKVSGKLQQVSNIVTSR